MATMFGRFEVQTELSKSETALICKAVDTKSNQVVAIKMQDLRPLGNRADAFVNTLITEGESTRDLASQNIVLLYGAGEIDGQFCAAMEYIQGNSVGTMLARNEGFSIWDLLDITRQVCAGLECADKQRVVHCSLEPAKIMVQWDGMVKILGYGISNMSLIEAESGKNLGRLMPYCSPEQIRGETMDLRSNLFTLGTILYEMVAGRKAFDAVDPVALVNQIGNENPALPSSVNPKTQPALEALIMKVLSKDPQDRHQSAGELLYDLEACKDNGKKAVSVSKPATPAPAPKADAVPAESVAGNLARAAAATKFTSGAVSSSFAAQAPSAPAVPTISSSPSVSARSAAAPSLGAPSEIRSGARSAGEADPNSAKSQAARNPVLSAIAVADETERRSSPRATIAPAAADPMMADPAVSEPQSAATAKSFSDLAEMPPLKAPIISPPSPEPADTPIPVAQIYPRTAEKVRTQPREAAEKALHQIATVPPRLILYSILGAVGLILIIGAAILFHVRSEDDGSTAAPVRAKSAAVTPSETSHPVVPQIDKGAPVVVNVYPSPKAVQAQKQQRNAANNNRRKAAPVAAAPVVTAGEALIESTPEGAAFQVDGKTDPSWITPFSVTGLGPGKHIISVSKAGYSSEIRSVEVVAGGKASLAVHLAPANALMAVNSKPAGAEVILDGKPTGRTTPSQFAVEKGSHTILLRQSGFLDETVTAELSAAQNFQYSPDLRALGNVSDMKTVGKLGKLFGRSGDGTAGMGSITVHTQPKGAQVAINQRVLDKTSPVDVMLGPGNYVVDVTLTGFWPVHKVISLDKGGKQAVEVVLERQ